MQQQLDGGLRRGMIREKAEERRNPVLFDAHLHFSEIPAEDRDLPGVALSSLHGADDPLLISHPPHILLSYGIHPLCLDGPNCQIKTIEDLASEGLLAAIGECGFDFYQKDSREESERQALFFEAQVDIAFRWRLPLVLHIRRAMAEVFARATVLKRLPAVIFHCYPGTAGEAKALLSRGINAFFSFGTPLLKGFPGSVRTAKEIPLERILFETDAPFQPPRGRERTLPADIVAVYEKAAKILEIDRDVLEEVVWNTVRKVFPSLQAESF